MVVFYLITRKNTIRKCIFSHSFLIEGLGRRRPHGKEGYQRMRFQNDKGEIQISSEVFTTITGAVATSCFGVKGMAARSKKDGLGPSAAQ